MFLEGYETFISAILASRVKIRVLNYDADLEIFNSVPQYPHFDHFFLIFEKIYILKIEPKYFSNWLNFQNSPEMNVSERVLITVKFLSKNIEKQKSYPRFSKLDFFFSSQ